MRFANRTTAITALLTALAIFGARELLPRAPDEAPAAGATTAPASTALTWPRGGRWRYTLGYQGSHETRQAGQPLSMQVDLAGTMTLESHGRRGDVTRLAMRFDAMPQRTMTLAGQNLLERAAVVVGPVAYIDLAADGAVAALNFEPGANRIFVDLARVVARTMQVQQGAGDRWRVVEHGPLGEAATAYAVLDRGADGLVFEKRRDGGAGPAGRYEVVVDRGGFLRAVEGTEQADDSTLDVQLALIEQGRFDPAPIAALETEADVARAAAETAREQLLAQRVGDLTPDALLNRMALHGRGGRVPDHKRFLWQATALLRTSPETCAALGALAARPDYPTAGRGLAFDLLAAAGSPAAQEALRGALSAEAVERDPGYRMLYQRLSLVQRPADATLDLLARRAERPGPEGRDAATYSLGAGIGHAALAGDVDRAAALAAPLADELASTDDRGRRITLLRALGNAGLPDQVQAIAAHADAEDQRVRIAAAAALRRGGATGRRLLVELTGDPASAVQQQALRALDTQALDADDLARLEARVVSGALHARSYARLVDLLAPHVGRSEVVDRTLQSVLERRLDDPSIKTRIRGLLGRG